MAENCEGWARSAKRSAGISVSILFVGRFLVDASKLVTISYQTKILQNITKKCLLVKHGLKNYMDTKAKCRHLKKLTLRQVFIRVYRLVIQ